MRLHVDNVQYSVTALCGPHSSTSFPVASLSTFYADALTEVTLKVQSAILAKDTRVQQTKYIVCTACSVRSNLLNLTKSL